MRVRLMGRIPKGQWGVRVVPSKAVAWIGIYVIESELLLNVRFEGVLILLIF